MAFKSLGQELIVVEPMQAHHVLEHMPPQGQHLHHLEVMDSEPMVSFPGDNMEVSEPIEIELVVDELPGAPPGAEIEVVDDEPEEMVVESDEEKMDENEAKKALKNEKWNWSAKGAEGFIPWIKDRLDSIPKHSGKDTAGIERAIAYMEKLDAEISKAMRMDIDGELDANKIEGVRSQIDNGLDRLNNAIDTIKKNKKSKKKKTAEDYNENFVKSAQKITGVHGTYVTVPLLASMISRIIVNGVVSNGKNLEDMFDKLASKYDLNKKEQAEVAWVLFDMGFPLRNDRGYMIEEEIDTRSEDNFDWAPNYHS